MMRDLQVEEKEILVSGSLQETLWRLEEVRYGFRAKSPAHVQEALEWVQSRQGLEGSYCDLFMPTSQDLARGVTLPTGERMQTNAGTRHVLGEEALRTLIVWKLGSSRPVAEALRGFNRILERGGKTGRYCCYTCTISFLRTLAVTSIDDADRILEKGLSIIKKARTTDGKWRGFPFYYTLLCLSEIESSIARDELEHASQAAERLMKRYKKNDRISLFRKLALKSAAEAAP
jgi:hypothetical protein